MASVYIVVKYIQTFDVGQAIFVMEGRGEFKQLCKMFLFFFCIEICHMERVSLTAVALLLKCFAW